MSCNRQGFRKEVGVIKQSRDEDDAKMSLLNPVPDPMPAHVNRLGHPEVDAVGRETDSNLIVAEDWGPGLRVAHVLQNSSLVGGDAGLGKGARVF